MKEGSSRVETRPNRLRHQLNLRRLTGWYYGVFYQDGHPRPGEFPPKEVNQLRKVLRRIKDNSLK